MGSQFISLALAWGRVKLNRSTQPKTNKSYDQNSPDKLRVVFVQNIRDGVSRFPLERRSRAGGGYQCNRDEAGGRDRLLHPNRGNGGSGAGANHLRRRDREG